MQRYSVQVRWAKEFTRAQKTLHRWRSSPYHYFVLKNHKPAVREISKVHRKAFWRDDHLVAKIWVGLIVFVCSLFGVFIGNWPGPRNPYLASTGLCNGYRLQGLQSRLKCSDAHSNVLPAVRQAPQHGFIRQQGSALSQLPFDFLNLYHSAPHHRPSVKSKQHGYSPLQSVVIKLLQKKCQELVVSGQRQPTAPQHCHQHPSSVTKVVFVRRQGARSGSSTLAGYKHDMDHTHLLGINVGMFCRGRLTSWLYLLEGAGLCPRVKPLANRLVRSSQMWSLPSPVHHIQSISVMQGTFFCAVSDSTAAVNGRKCMREPSTLMRT